MLMKLLNVLYLLVAIAMVALILMQRGSGAAAGSSFGGGASGSVFGARGAGNFLTKTTKWLAIVFIAISLFMAWFAAHTATGNGSQDLGVMSSAPTAPVRAADRVQPTVAPTPTPQQTGAGQSQGAPSSAQPSAPPSEKH